MSPTKIILVTAFVWFTLRLIRSPKELGLRTLVIFLGLRLLGAPSTNAMIQNLSGGLVTPSMGKLIMNLALVGSLYCLTLFFLFSAADPGMFRRARLEAIPMAAVATIMTLAVILTPNADEVYPTRGALPTEALQMPSVVIFYLTGLAYFAYGSSQAARRGFQYANESPRRARLGLRMAAIGLCILVMGHAMRGLFVVIRSSGGTVSESLSDPVDLGGVGGLAIFIIGVCLVGLAARVAELRVLLRHRRLYSDLRPLWELLHKAFPQNTLDRQPKGGLLSPIRTHRHYWRRVIEIRDGLVQLSPHIADIGSSPQDSVEEQVTSLREAIRRQRDGVQPSSSSAVLVAAPQGTDRNADVDQLVQLSRALAT